MAEISHKDQPSIPGPSPAAAAKAVTQILSDPTVTPDQLEAAVKAVLIKNRKEAIEASKPREPDWGSLTEQQAMAQDIYVPTIEHELPDYMNMKLKDPEYEVVWSSKDQRRIGQLTAQGYELLKQEHVHPDFRLPLLFNSEGMYEYLDVVAMRVHKRILFGKRKKALQVSLNQLANRNKPPRVRLKDSYDLSEQVPNNLQWGGSLYSDIL